MEPSYRLKLRRAKEHLDFIAGKGTEFVKNNFDGPAPWHHQPEDQWTILYRGEVTDPDPMWGTYFGDVVNNTRSALDHLVCAMILRNDTDHSIEHAQFPIYDGKQQWINDIEARDRSTQGPAMTDGLSDEVFAAIKGLQPYNLTGAAKRRSPLLLLLIASNADKHRTVHATMARVAPRDQSRGRIRIDPPGYFQVRAWRIPPPGTPMKTGTELCRMKLRVLQLPGPDTQVGVHVLAPMEMAFYEEGKTLMTTHPDLWAMVNEAWRVVKTVEKAAGIVGMPSQ